VVVLAPAGGWAEGDDSFRELLGQFTAMQELAQAAAPFVDEIVTDPDVRRQATELIVERFEHIPEELIAHLIVGVARCADVRPLIGFASSEGWKLDAARIDCPVRVVWGTADRVLPWPSAAARFRDEWLPDADWVELDGAGHCPQLDMPLETAELIADFA
jgi:pimeloyl-ACP methyl ester carboxylesterase